MQSPSTMAGIYLVLSQCSYCTIKISLLTFDEFDIKKYLNNAFIRVIIVIFSQNHEKRKKKGGIHMLMWHSRYKIGDWPTQWRIVGMLVGGEEVGGDRQRPLFLLEIPCFVLWHATLLEFLPNMASFYSGSSLRTLEFLGALSCLPCSSHSPGWPQLTLMTTPTTFIPRL